MVGVNWSAFGQNISFDKKSNGYVRKDKGVSLLNQPAFDIHFGRQLRKNEEPEYRATIQQALNELGKQNLVLIMPQKSAPARLGQDIGIGSPYSDGYKELIEFLELNGFNGIQLSPDGKIKHSDRSPYVSTVFSKDPLSIDLFDLTKDKWGHILPADKVREVVNNNPNKGVNRVNYDYAEREMIPLLREAYENFLIKKDNELSDLGMNFEKFKEKNRSWLRKDALYEVLASENNNESYVNWKNPVDKDLIRAIKDNTHPKHNEAKVRIQDVESKHSEDIDFYKFCQFIINEQEKELEEFRHIVKPNMDDHFKFIADALVGWADRDVWANPDAFVDNLYVGCPYGGSVELDGEVYGVNGCQTWDIPVVDPKKLFNQDETLGESGKLLYAKFHKLLKAYDGVRIDHILGLIDPWVYSQESVDRYNQKMRFAAEAERDKRYADKNRLVEEARNVLGGRNLSQMADKYDPDRNFVKILEKIILPCVEKNGVDNNMLVCEDLGHMDGSRFYEIYNPLNLSGISQIEWKRGQDSSQKNWMLIGSHDSRPLSVMAQDKRDDNNSVLSYLAGYTMPDAATYQDFYDKKGYQNEDEPSNFNDYKGKLNRDNKLYGKTKFVEMFNSHAKNIQVSFMDFFGMTERYNTPGTGGDENWTLRLPNNFKEFYHRNLEKDDHVNIALNMPETLKRAILARDAMSVASTPNDRKDDARRENSKKHEKLLMELQKFDEILKEPEEKHTNDRISNPFAA